MEEEKGLYNKYEVTNTSNGEIVENVFVLRPETDEAARFALLAYAANSTNEKLRSDILVWLRELED